MREQLQIDCASIMKSAIALNDQWKSFVCKEEEQLTRMSPLAFMMSYAVVRMNFGRKFGYTKFIGDNATENDLIIIPKNKHRNLYPMNILTITLQNVLRNELYFAKPFDRIWIDNIPDLYGSRLEDIVRPFNRTRFYYEQSFIIFN